jgi:hypothetical protein
LTFPLESHQEQILPGDDNHDLVLSPSPDAALVDEAESDLELSELATHQSAAVRGLVPFVPREGRPATLFGEPTLDAPPRAKKKLCADHESYSLHDAVRIGREGRQHRLPVSRALAR